MPIGWLILLLRCLIRKFLGRGGLARDSLCGAGSSSGVDWELPRSIPGSSKSVCGQRKWNKNLVSVVGITELPDDILVTILSLLPMKVAARTSILSQRWKNLWKLITSHLDFDDWNALQEIDRWQLEALRQLSRRFNNNNLCERMMSVEMRTSRDFALLQLKRSKYIKWVNQILDSHKGGSVDTFAVHFDLDLPFKPHVDGWINFAIEKRVQRLELDLERLGLGIDTRDCYPFPVQILGNPNITFLKAISLNYVDATKEVLESLLLKCPSLEFLRISNSECLVGEVVIGVSLKLIHLEIVRCPNLKDLHISALKLRSLTFDGRETTRLRLENTPDLAAISLGGLYCQTTIRAFSRLPPTSPFRTRLRMLTLDIVEEDTFGRFLEFPVLGNLKQLELIMKVSDRYSILGCTSMIKACPVLYKLMLQFNWTGALCTKRELKKQKCLLAESLKGVELRKFRGGTTDVEMATLLFENANFLDKICIDTRTRNLADQKNKMAAEECATQLVTRLYPSAQLLVL
ncbi:hypothetical protein LguiB_008092 [Lonicera macranthoides]